MSLSCTVAPKANVDRALAAREVCLESWERMFDYMVLRKTDGKTLTKSRIEILKAQNMSARATRTMTTAARKEYGDMS